ncbi:MAG: PAS domain S-box protein [Vicinamibacterales bacterium]
MTRKRVPPRRTPPSKSGDAMLKLGRMLDVSLNEFYVFDPHTLHFRYVNESARRNLGYSMEALRALTPLDLKPAFTESAFRALIEPLLRREQEKHVFQAVHRRRDGSTYPVEVHLQLIGHNASAQFVAVIVDITERKQAEEAVRKRDRRLATLISNLPGYVYSVANDMDYTPEFISEGVERITGYTQGEYLVDRTITCGAEIHPEDKDATWRNVQQAVAAHEPYECEYRIRTKSGELRTVWERGRGIFGPTGELLFLEGFVTDITERKRTDQALRLANSRLRALSFRLLEVQETDRRDLARELHDEIGQALTAAKINLESLQRFPEPMNVARRLNDSVAIVERALQQVRSLSLELRPPLLDDMGLVPALRWLADQQAQRAGLCLQFEEAPPIMHVEEATATACFRIAQEALTNVLRHAAARNITVSVQVQDGALHLRVGDDGTGFDVTTARHRATLGTSLGLIGMEERATLVGGGIQWHSMPGRGTEVHAWFPFREAADDTQDTPALP